MDIKINKTYKMTGGDEVSHYDASFEVNPTLEEFVEWVLTTNPDEYGYINDLSRLDEWEWPERILEYRYGKIVKVCDDYDQIKKRTISLHKMDGGWTVMDYTIKTE